MSLPLGVKLLWHKGRIFIKETMRKKCSCGNNVESQGFNSRGNKRYRNICSSCRNKVRSRYAGFKGDKCDKCGFVPAHSCQLDVDHIDGNRDNNSPENLQTLCANCHRLKTMEERDYLSRAIRNLVADVGLQVSIFDEL